MTGTELIEYLSAEGFNVFPDPNFIPAEMDESQLPALFVFSTGGGQSDNDLPLDFPNFQVVLKGKSYSINPIRMHETETLAKALIKLLNKKVHYQIGKSYIYISRAIQSNPIPIGLDEKDRPIFSTNFSFKIQEFN
ncbi:minor capsid protein [Jeotgalibacillus alimentarius]|nr:minor capsid protein [Jeotgalibacillus alimentarius]